MKMIRLRREVGLVCAGECCAGVGASGIAAALATSAMEATRLEEVTTAARRIRPARKPHWRGLRTLKCIGDDSFWRVRAARFTCWNRLVSYTKGAAPVAVQSRAPM